ncbi:NXPE family member 3 [Oryzias melastigma]|uniref:Neurexophilin and PC-esterase domain family member 3 n=1 Tax=Oryzias melastigma TaxID=30732 RepID=A0A3B3BDR1_ORYME|nr:NXPE family member 3 [Oryzias melastigma]XP_024141405.1 NXPE family member 3 [Oryzias melastigma]
MKRLFRMFSLPNGFIFLFLAVGFLIFLFYSQQLVESRNKPTTISMAVPVKPDKLKTFPPSHQQPSKEAVEMDVLKNLIAWPSTPLLPINLSWNDTSDPAHSSFTVLPKRGGGQWCVGDELEVLIQIYNFQGKPKKSGGDVLLARLHSPSLLAGVAGKVVDHLNGSYSALFPLLWEGNVQVEVILVHSSEAVTVLQQVSRLQPYRIFFRSLFRSGPLTESTLCNVYIDAPQEQLCNYTDLYTGEPWFCYKPKKLSCDARVTHAMGGFKKNISRREEMLFQRGINLKVSIPPSSRYNISVHPRVQEQTKRTSNIVRKEPSGYYYHGVWRPLDGTKLQQFNSSKAASQCLRRKVLHLFGDSTIRQWFEYLISSFSDLKKFDLHTSQQAGPLMALDYTNNIMVTYRCHGPPIRFANVPVSQLRYIANELDHIDGGPNTAIVIGIWSHFSTFPVDVYIRRLQSIRKAVVRLLSRAPDTLVVIRTANPKALTVYETLTNSDWYSIQRDKLLREVFKGLNVRLVDAWDMVLAHHLPHNLHPQPPIIKNMIDLLLSYICPPPKDKTRENQPKRLG